MKKLLILLSFIITSCSSPYIVSDFSRNYTSLASTDSIKVLPPTIYLNRDNSRDLKIGTIFVGDKGTTIKCDSITMLNIIKDSARVNGANLIGLTKHIKPSFWGSTCHQFSADFLKENMIKSDTTNQEYTTLSEKIKKENSYDKFLFNYKLSYLKRTVKSDESSDFSKSLSDQLKSGYGMSLATYYKYNKNSGFGLKYKSMKYDAEIENAYISFDDGRPIETGLLKSNINIHYFAFSTLSDYSFGKNKKNSFIIESSIGYTHYNELLGINTEIKTTGGNLGYDINLDYLRTLNSSLKFGINLGFFASNISQITINNGATSESYNLEKGDALNINNLNIGLSLTYSL